MCCDNSANDGLACLTNITQMFNNIKTVMEFRVLDLQPLQYGRSHKIKIQKFLLKVTCFFLLQLNQLDNFDEKYKRLGRVS